MIPVSPSGTSTSSLQQHTVSLDTKRNTQTVIERQEEEKKEKKRAKGRFFVVVLFVCLFLAIDCTEKYKMFSVYSLNRCVFREDLNEEMDVECLTV